MERYVIGAVRCYIPPFIFVQTKQNSKVLWPAGTPHLLSFILPCFFQDGVEDSSDCKDDSSSSDDNIQITHEVALKLDEIMCTVMEYLHSTCFVNGESKIL